MLFNSYIFILMFLPIVLLGYYFCRNRKAYKLSRSFLIVMSLLFYAYFNYMLLPVFFISILVNYLFAFYIQRTGKGALYVAGIAVNILFLFVFKYYNFFISTVNSVFKSDLALLNILMPLGYSFITFEQIIYLSKIYKRNATVKLDEYLFYITYFPKIAQGPIVDYNDFINELKFEEKSAVNWKSIQDGIVLFAMGLFKKVILADTFLKATDYGYSNLSSLDSTNAILVMLFYTFMIYFDFSGYCDMAKGVSKMLDITIDDNFNSPYKAVNIKDFWKRWHITLTGFLTKYIYIPLGGNRKGKIRTLVNIIIIFAISGLWHGANYTFILWGLMHGILMVIHRVFAKGIEKLPKVLGGVLTFILINFTWVMFRAQSVADALLMYKQIFTGGFGPVLGDIYSAFHLEDLMYVLKFRYLPDFIRNFDTLPMIIFILLSGYLVFFSPNSTELTTGKKNGYIYSVLAAVALVYCLVSMSGVTSFVYFNF